MASLMAPPISVKPGRKRTLRQRQAEGTRILISDTARALFGRHGYGATTIEEIAAEAGVGVSTVYAIFTNKRRLLAEVRWRAVQSAGVPSLRSAALAEPDSRRRLALIAEMVRRLYETAGDVFAVQRAAADVDPGVAATWARVRSERAHNIAQALRPLRARLRAGVAPRDALAIVDALMGFELFEDLVRRSGWSPQQYQEWLANTLIQQLLGNRTQG
jgi:TetR/AcrR family transcriptional regulator, regulator of autoinduction and epiphytic fitness